MSFWDSLSTILSVGAPIVGGLFGRPKNKPSAAEQQMMANATQSANMARAATDPNDPMYRNLVRMEEETSRRDISESVNEMLRQRKRMSRGYGGGTGGYFSSDSGDQNISKAIARAGLDAGDRARGTARNTLLQGSQALMGGAPALQSAAQMSGRRSDQRGQFISNIGAAIGQGAGYYTDEQKSHREDERERRREIQRRRMQQQSYGQQPGNY